MNPKRIVLHGLRVALFALLVLQSLQMFQALRMVDLPDAFRVSPLLLAALVFKALLILANAALLWLTHRALRHPHPPALRPATHGESK